MKLFSSLDRKDSTLMLWFLGAVIALIGAGTLLPSENNDGNRLPSSYLSGQHGALAAYETLVRSGYTVERWEGPLPDLAAKAGPNSVVIFAQPFTRAASDVKAVRDIIEHGGRVIATGLGGGLLLPGGSSGAPGAFDFSACRLTPNGLDTLASSGEIWMVPASAWQAGRPGDRVQYDCAGRPAVVEYDWAKGHVVWWASSTPLENGSLARGQNLNLLLNSVGPREGRRIYWDESLHGEARSLWSFAGGPALTLLRIALPVLALLVVLSFSRRRGPVRDLPSPPRAAPIEFIGALGSLYQNAGASSAAVAIAWERFRRHALALCGMKSQPLSAHELATALKRRFPRASAALDADLAACEAAADNDTLTSREALRLVRLLSAHLDQLKEAATPHRPQSIADKGLAHPQERVS